MPEKLTQLRVLVVDDNPAACEILQEPLTAIVAHGGSSRPAKRLLRAIRQHDATSPYDLVFMDWRMPEMDGLQASRYVKSDETLKHPARDRVGHGVRPRRGARRSGAARVGRLPGQARYEINDCRHAGERFRAAIRGLYGFDSSARASVARGARILLAEDNEINQQIAVELLEGAGAKVTVVNNGRLAVDKLCGSKEATPPFDIVLMDLQMPEMDGYQATAKLRSEPRLAALPIIAMTAHATMEERQRCLASGMVDHISKPIDPGNLYETIRRYYKPAAVAGGETPPTVAAPATVPKPAPGRNGQIDGHDLSTISEINLADGLARVGGNQKLYIKLLRQFFEQQAQAPKEISEYLASGDLKTAERVAHTIKGVAGNLGIKLVQQAAGDLEKGIRDSMPATNWNVQGTVSLAL